MLRFTKLLCLLAFSGAVLPAFAGTKLLRFPDICGERVVFTYAGDLWLSSLAGGTATRLTAGPGLEQSARFSPDCSQIAFTGQYGGDDQVFVIPARGGEPTQLTFYPTPGPLPQRWGFDSQVYGWTSDGKSVLFRSWRESINESHPKLFTVPVEGGLPVALPMPSAGVGRYSPDGKQIVYSPKLRDFRTWNRYIGGWAQDLFIYDFASRSAQNITGDRGTDRDPVWIGDAIYFLSDRSAYLNLYRYDVSSGVTRQLTNHVDADARWASGDAKGKIIYELDGALRVYDTLANRDLALDITVPSDLVGSRASERSVAGLIEDFSLSSNGQRVLFTARGDVFSAPVKRGITLDLTHTPGVHERESSWSHDGKQVAYVSDASGEEAIWIGDADGGDRRQLTTASLGRLYAPKWSPDGSRIVFVDNQSRLHLVTVKSGKVTQIADDPGFSMRDYAWSASGNYLAYTLTDDQTLLPRLYLQAIDTGKRVQLGDGHANAYDPAFSPDGNYLYFMGDREWAPQLASVEWNYATNRTASIFAVALRKDVENPFAPKNDLATSSPKDEQKGGKGKTQSAAIEDRIDFDGISGRVVRVPLAADNYRWIGLSSSKLFYVTGPAEYYGRESGGKNTLKSFGFAERDSKEVFTGIDDGGDGSLMLSLAADGGSAVLRSDNQYQFLDLSQDSPGPKSVSTAGLYTLVDPKAEYAGIFAEVWRRYRDHFYAQNMHGYDWDALRAKYQPLLRWVGDRSDLNYLLGQMVAELNSGHTYVSGGDLGMPARPNVGLLGARFVLDTESGRYRIASILQGDNDEERYRSPLTAYDVDVKVGDYVLAINNRPLAATDNPYRLLRVGNDQLVRLTVNDKPSVKGARQVLVSPIDSEMRLNYHAWVEHNRAYVAKASDGKLGYLHIPDMGGDGIREFIKWYYPQMRMSGLVVDVRDNGGGNVSSMILNRLARPLFGVDYTRGSDIVETYPQQAPLGHLAALCNGTTASDGDIFSYMFQQMNLGPLIGTRTWGGVIGITDWGPLIDGGRVHVPQFALASAEGQYIVEGVGVEPDMVVENTVSAVLSGQDPQLDRAIQELQKKIAAEPVQLPPRPADPDKTPR